MSSAPSIDSFLAGLDDRGAGTRIDEAGVVTVVREYLAAVRGYLQELHASPAGGLAVNEAHSDLIDRLMRRLFEFAEETYFSAGDEEQSDLCVVAV